MTMQTETTHSTGSPDHRDLGDGLVLRWSTAEDTDGLAQLTGNVFRDGPDEPFNQPLADLVYHMMSGTFPLMGPRDYALVEDTRKPGKTGNKIVACTCLWRQNWEYEGIPFRIGRPEIVATDPEYRNRGLIRAIFELVHARSAEEGHLVQAITGIPYYYRQFGYEYALDLDGRIYALTSQIPTVGVNKHYGLRDATLRDIPFINTIYNRQRGKSIVSATIDESWWRYQIESWHKARRGAMSPPQMSDAFWHVQVIFDQEAARKGYVIMPVARWKLSVPVFDLEVAPGVNLQEVLPSLLHVLHKQGKEMPKYHGSQEVSRIAFCLGRSHPVYDLLGQALTSVREAPYAWYVRVPDLVAFLRHIAPVLERRLEQSALSGYSGDLRMNFYRGGLRMVFEHGRLTTVEDWRNPVWGGNAVAGFPPLVFLQLLFGRRSLDDLRYAYPDVRANDEAQPVLNALFPARPSWVIPLG